MSLINDALNKAERDRAESALADAAGLDAIARARKRRELKKTHSLGAVVLNASLLVAGFAVIILVLLRDQTAHVAPESSEPVTAAARLEAQPTLPPSSPPVPSPEPAASPFLAAPTPALPTATRSADYELAGMTAVGDQTLLSILRRSDQRSMWIPVGKSVGEVTVVSYDPASDRAVIRVEGRQLNIGMRSGPLPAAGQAAE
ncbi:MAG TPA: hypothetical protein VEQ65_09550 [Opitutus sp.]|nr:hypothetical protein [Opitutus sp.]